MSQPTRRACVRAAAARLDAAGIDAAGEEARRLAEAAWGLDAAGLMALAGDAADAESQATLDALVDRREAREPLSQIIGRQAFWTLDLSVSREVLTPRADTETIVEAGLIRLDGRSKPRILDIATGSGAILLALLAERSDASGLGTDLSGEALSVARANAAAFGLQGRAAFVRARWAEGVDARFDLVTCNPPYIASAVLDRLEPEVRDHEPRLALDGGADGLEAYRAVLPRLGALLAPSAAAVLEIGYDQSEAVGALARAQGFHGELKRDLAGRDRALVLTPSQNG